MIANTLIILSFFVSGVCFYLKFTNINDTKKFYFPYISGLIWGSVLFVIVFMIVITLYQGSNLLLYTWGVFYSISVYLIFMTYKKIDLQYFSISIFIIFCLSIIFYKLSILILSADSFWLVHFSKELAMGNFEHGNIVLTMWGVFLSAIHANSDLLKTYIFYNYMPLMSFSLLLVYLFALNKTFNLYRFQSKFRITFLLISLLLLLCSNLFIYSFFVIHTGMISALFLFLFAMHWLWYIESKKDFHIFFAYFALLGFSLMRIESPLIAFVFLALFLDSCDVSLRKKQTFMGSFLGIFLIWYSFLLFHISTEHDLLGPTEIKIMLLFCSVGLILVSLLKLNSFQKIFKYLVKNIILIFILCILGLIVYKPTHMLISFSRIIQNLFVTGSWGLCWYFLVTLFVYLNYVVKKSRLKELDFILIVSAVYFLFTYAIVITRVPYRLGEGDSANRMILHIFPLVVFYISVYAMKYYNDSSKNANNSYH